MCLLSRRPGIPWRDRIAQATDHSPALPRSVCLCLTCFPSAFYVLSLSNSASPPTSPSSYIYGAVVDIQSVTRDKAWLWQLCYCVILRSGLGDDDNTTRAAELLVTSNGRSVEASPKYVVSKQGIKSTMGPNIYLQPARNREGGFTRNARVMMHRYLGVRIRNSDR